MTTANPYIGSSLDDFLEEEGLLAEMYVTALKRVLVWQVAQEIEKLRIEQDSNGE
jgi:antitoxin HicB